ncbi:MAG: type II CAAX endopeptidase family protein [Paludibacter sp.]|nr:type II CAAX endopeptidase family protein [Paludibacter sp.]
MVQYNLTPKKSIILGGILLVIFLIFFPSLIYFAFGIKKPEHTVNLIFFSELYNWLFLGLIYLYSVKIEKQKFLLWTEVNYPQSFYLKAVIKIFLICFAGSIVIAFLLKLSGLYTVNAKAIELAKLIHQNKLLVFLVPLTAGFTEEILIRGYLLTRLELFFENTNLAIFISALLFGIAHLNYGTVSQFIFPIFLGIVYAFHYKKYKSIKVLIASHFLWDLMFLYFKRG